MPALSIQIPYPIFSDRDGQPLENGYVWIGQPYVDPQTNPVQVYLDDALSIPVAQPLRTIGGYVSNSGTPAQLYIDGVNFSIRVQDNKGTQVYYFPDGSGINPDAAGVTYNPGPDSLLLPGGPISVKAALDEITDDGTNANGAALISFLQAGTSAVPTTVQAKLRETVSVKDFGAVGDGLTDDTLAIQSALDSGALEVHISAGTYIVSSITVTGVIVSGSGTLKWKSGTSTSMITLSGSGCKLDGLTLDGNASGQTSSTAMIVTASAPNAVIEGCTVKNGRYKAFLSDVANSPGIAIRNNLFIDWGTITSCDVVSFRSPRFVASANRFENIGDGHCIRTGLLSSDPTTTPVTNGTIVGNVFYNTQHVGVTCEIYTQGLSITGNTFDTLNAGVKIESSGATQFDITIDGNVFKNLDGSGVGTSLNLTGNNVIFSNNTVRDCAGVCDVGDNSIVSGNTFDNCGDLASATSAIRATTTAFSKAVVSSNVILNSPYRAIEGGADAVIVGNVIKNTTDRAINLGSADRARLIGNIIDGCTYGIISNSTSNDLLLSANEVRNASVAAYSITDSASAYIDQNNFGLSLAIPTLNIATGAVTAPRRTGAIVKIDTEGAAASDDLDTINVLDGGQIGNTIILQPVTATRVVTVKDDTGNLRLAGDFVMNSTVDTITLVWMGSTWNEVSRSDNS